jgi:hypothetical protein
VTKKKVFVKTLDLERKGFVSTRGEQREQERKRLNKISFGSSQSKSDRLNKMDALLASLLNQQFDTISIHSKVNKLNKKLIDSLINCIKNSIVINKGLTIGLSIKNSLQNYTKWVLDTGVTDHMMGKLNLLNNYCKINDDQFLRLPTTKNLKSRVVT